MTMTAEELLEVILDACQGYAWHMSTSIHNSDDGAWAYITVNGEDFAMEVWRR